MSGTAERIPAATAALISDHEVRAAYRAWYESGVGRRVTDHEFGVVAAASELRRMRTALEAALRA